MAKKILIIDDSAVDAGIVESLLKQEGFEVSVATTGREGISRALEVKPDLVVLDIMMPDMDGYAVCKNLKSESSLRNTIVVMLSIKDNIDDITKAFQTGADDYIIKPPFPDFMVKKIKLYMGMK